MGQEMSEYTEYANELTAWGMKFYDDMAPLRELIAEYPELKDEIVNELGKALTNSFAGNFNGPSPHGE